MNILIIYESLEGQTEKIAQHIAERFRTNKHQVDINAAQALPVGFKIEKYDAAIIGGPIHMGRYPKNLRKFVSQHHDWLNRHPSALFTVCMAIRSKRPGSREEVEKYARRFSEETQWHATQMVAFAGAVKYTQYGFITRLIMKNISRREGSSTDTSRDHEYTDWDEVDRFTDEFFTRVTR